MNIAFLTIERSIHINIKFKYFKDDKRYNLYYFMIKGSKNYIAKPILENVKIINAPYKNNSKANILKNAIYFRDFIKKNNIQILHIIDMGLAIYSLLLKSKRLKIIIENNGSDVLIAPKINPKLIKYYKLYYILSNAIVQDSLLVQRTAIDKYGAPKSNNKVIELGIDCNLFNLNIKENIFRKKYNISQNCKIIFSPRAFDEKYNINSIINTIPIVKKEIKNVKYVFCSYLRNDSYIRKIKSMDLENDVIFLRYIDNEKEMPYIYKDADVVISIPSSDSSPRTVYEALATGKPVIVSELPWYHDKFIANENIVPIKLNELSFLSDTIIKILNGYIKINARENFEIINKQFNYRKSASKLKNLYRKVL